MGQITPMKTANTPRIGMPRRFWIVFGAFTGALLAFLTVALAPPNLLLGSLVWLMLGGGGVLGGLLGARALGMAPRVRNAIGAIGGAVLLGTIGGFGFLSLDVTSPTGPIHPERNFALGFIVAGMAGTALGRRIAGERPSLRQFAFDSGVALVVIGLAVALFLQADCTAYRQVTQIAYECTKADSHLGIRIGFGLGATILGILLAVWERRPSRL